MKNVLISLAFLVSGGGLLACSDDGPDQNPTDTTSSASAGGAGGTTGTGGAGGVGGDAAGGAGGGGVGSCDVFELPSEAMDVVPMAAGGTPPAPTGGTIVDGTYVATSVAVYNNPASPGSARQALIVSDGGTRFRQRAILSNGTDQTECGEIIVDGTSVTFRRLATDLGPVSMPSDKLFVGFDATPSSLTLHFEPNDTDQINLISFGKVD